MVVEVNRHLRFEPDVSRALAGVLTAADELREASAQLEGGQT